MDTAADVEQLIVASHALARIAAVTTRNETPAAQWRTLSILQNGPLRIGELARLSRVTQPGMTRLVAQLERTGLVTRGQDPDDVRATRVEVTAGGVDALARWRDELREAVAPLFSDLDDADRAALRRAAEILTERTAQEV